MHGIARLIKAQPRRRRLPRPIPPLTIERSYIHDLKSINVTLREMCIEKLFPKLRFYISNNPRLKRDALADDAFDALEDFKVEFFRRYSTEELKRIAIRQGLNLADYNAEQLSRVIGINVFGSEPWLEDQMATFALNNANLIKTIPDRFFNDVSMLMFDGLKNGTPWDELQGYLMDRFGVSDWNAERLARDQISKLNAGLNEFRQEDIGVDSYIWRGTLDQRERDSHLEKEGNEYQWDDPPADTGHPGDDILCVTGETQIKSIGALNVAYSRKYSGKIVSIHTEGGGCISVTPNHPILTDRGWVPAQHINDSDKLFKTFGGDIFKAFSSEINNGFIDAQKMFDLFSVSFSEKRVAGIETQFHKDGTNSEVRIIDSKTRLMFDINTLSLKKIEQSELINSSSTFSNTHSGSDFLLSFFRSISSNIREVSAFGLFDPLIGCHVKPFNFFGITLAPDWALSFNKNASNYSSIYSESFRESVFTFTSEIQSNDLVNREFFLVPWNNSFFKSVRVSHIELNPFEGDVFNFQTDSGTYIADNVIISNCRCWAEPNLEKFYL